jgi:hypothetical protein
MEPQSVVEAGMRDVVVSEISEVSGFPLLSKCPPSSSKSFANFEKSSVMYEEVPRIHMAAEVEASEKACNGKPLTSLTSLIGLWRPQPYSRDVLSSVVVHFSRFRRRVGAGGSLASRRHHVAGQGAWLMLGPTVGPGGTIARCMTC